MPLLLAFLAEGVTFAGVIGLFLAERTMTGSGFRLIDAFPAEPSRNAVRCNLASSSGQPTGAWT